METKSMVDEKKTTDEDVNSEKVLPIQRKRRAVHPNNFPKKVGTKKCPRCKIIKDTGEFGLNRKVPDGCYTYCKKCDLERREQAKEDTLEKYIPNIYRTCKNGASSRDLRVEITKEDLFKLYEKQKGLCALSGKKMTLIRHRKDDDPSIKNIHNLSIDRIDSNGHYTVNNIHLVCSCVNMFKTDLSMKDFYLFAEGIRKNNKTGVPYVIKN